MKNGDDITTFVLQTQGHGDTGTCDVYASSAVPGGRMLDALSRNVAC